MPIPEAFHRSWRTLDASIGRVQPTWWGAVVTDERFPAVWDANYARIDESATDLRLEDVAPILVPALAASGATLFHTVMFHPETSTVLLTDLSTAGHALTWDLVMERTDEPSIAVVDVLVEELESGAELWSRIGASLELFGVQPHVAPQLLSLEQLLSSAVGKRWFGIKDPEGALVSVGALLVSQGVGYVDNVATFPEARGRGYATALTAWIVDEAWVSGAGRAFLLADPDDSASVRMYERLGFRGAGLLASTKGPLSAVPRSD